MNKTPTSLPLKIFATNVPPGRSTHAASVSALRRSCDWMYSSRSCRPVTSGAPSERTRSASAEASSPPSFDEDFNWDPPRRCECSKESVLGWVISACNVTTPGRGAIGWRSSATMMIGWSGVERGERYLLRTCDQDPGAAQRSTTRRTWGVVDGFGILESAVSMVGKRLNCSLSWRSLNAERARYPCSFARR